MTLTFKMKMKVIFTTHERHNALKRPPVSNIDGLIIVMSAVEPKFSTQLLDRFLVIAHSYNLSPSILVTKKILLVKRKSIISKQY